MFDHDADSQSITKLSPIAIINKRQSLYWLIFCYIKEIL